MGSSVATPMTDADPLCRLTSAELFKGFSTGSLSPVDVATAALDRAETVNATFNAFTRIDRDAVITSAVRAEMHSASLIPTDSR